MSLPARRRLQRGYGDEDDAAAAAAAAAAGRGGAAAAWLMAGLAVAH